MESDVQARCGADTLREAGSRTSVRTASPRDLAFAFVLAMAPFPLRIAGYAATTRAFGPRRGSGDAPSGIGNVSAEGHGGAAFLSSVQPDFHVIGQWTRACGVCN